jgi:HD-GYP domain-containing protein (c-di-GMP phosphodiesterase class II)
LGENIAGRVLKNREAMLVKDIDEISWMKNKINVEFKSFISAPVICAELRSFDVPLGVINVTNKAGNESFSEQDLQTLSFIANTASIAINNQQNRQMLEKSYLDTVKALIVALEARDTYTKGHSVRVMEYSEGIGRRLGLEERMIGTIRDAAILHDIGKIGIADKVLLKSGRLDPGEHKEIRKHSEISYAIVNSISSLQEVGMIVRQHHERYDGKGYPSGLKDEEIHIGARIMAVADAYDAMTSNRPYRHALDAEDVVGELMTVSGAQLDPQCVEAFIQYISEKKAAENESENSSEQIGSA